MIRSRSAGGAGSWSRFQQESPQRPWGLKGLDNFRAQQNEGRGLRYVPVLAVYGVVAWKCLDTRHIEIFVNTG